MCRRGTYLDYCTLCAELRDNTRHFVIRCERAVASGKVCERLGPVVPGEVEKGYTLCAACYEWMTAD